MELNRVITIAASLSFLFFVCLSCFSLERIEAAFLSDDWQYRETEDAPWQAAVFWGRPEICTDSHTVWLSVLVKPDNPEKNMLFFQTNGQAVRIHLAGRMIYEHGDMKKTPPFGYGRSWHMVKLPPLTRAEYLTIELHGKSAFRSNQLSEFSLDAPNVQTQKIFIYDLPYALSLPVAVLLAMIVAMYSFHRAIWIRFGYRFLFLLAVLTIWSISLSHSVQLFLDWPAVWLAVGQFFTYLIPLAGDWMIYELIEPPLKRRVFFVIACYGVLALGSLLLECFGFSGLGKGIYLLYLLLVPCQLFVLRWVIFSIRHYHNVYLKFTMFPFLGLSVLGIFDVWNQTSSGMLWKSHLLPLSTYTLIAVVVCMIREQLLQEHKMQARAIALEYEIAKAEEAAEVDLLTGCRNRLAFDNFIQQRMEQGDLGEFSMIMIDVDHFKAINDQYGHDAGDCVLRDFAAIVRQQLDKSCQFFRWGGEEFVVYCQGAGLTEAACLAEKIRERIERAEILAQQQVTISLGVAFWHGESDLPTELFRRMDDALYQAKRKGRNRVVMETMTRS